MKRSLAVTLAGMLLTLLVISLGMAAVLSQSPDWRAITTSGPNGNESFDIWLKHFDKVIPTVIVSVYFPAALLVGFLVGSFSTRHKVTCAIVASSPAWAPLLFVTLRAALTGFVIAGVAAFGSRLSKWVLARINRVRQGDVAPGSAHGTP